MQPAGWFIPDSFLMKVNSDPVPRAFPLMEHYYTIQGEGMHSGKPAYFLRLGGCDVGCFWCDVKDSWDASTHPVTDIETMLGFVTQSGAVRVVVTGGEPAMYDLRQLTDLFRKSGIKLFAETSGAYELSGNWDWICVSPKKFKKPLPSMLKGADELKVIVYNTSDFEWALENAKAVSEDCRLFVQPEFSVSGKMLPEIIRFVKNHPDWSISLQTHKFMNIP